MVLGKGAPSYHQSGNGDKSRKVRVILNYQFVEHHFNWFDSYQYTTLIYNFSYRLLDHLVFLMRMVLLTRTDHVLRGAKRSQELSGKGKKRTGS